MVFFLWATVMNVKQVPHLSMERTPGIIIAGSSNEVLFDVQPIAYLTPRNLVSDMPAKKPDQVFTTTLWSFIVNWYFRSTYAPQLF